MGSVAALVRRAVLGVTRCGLPFLFEAIGALLLLLALLVVLAQVALAAEAT